MTEQDFKNLTAAQIIRAMTAGLRKRWVEVDMGTFGAERGGVCYGCAATNALCQLQGRAFLPYEIDENFHADAIGIGSLFVEHFELGIDGLRSGDIEEYNDHAQEIGIAPIVNPLDLELPRLYDNYTEAELAVYDALADSQPDVAKLNGKVGE